jgi:hypothetical protein
VKRMTSGPRPVVLAICVAALTFSVSTFRDARAQTTPQAAPAPAPAPVATSTDHSTALMLLDRVATLLDAALNDKSTKTKAVGTSGSSEGGAKVVIDRAALDEIRAEVAQIRLLLKDEPKSSVALRPREKTEAAR